MPGIRQMCPTRAREIEGNRMKNEQISAAVDNAFDAALKAIQPRLERELFPNALADEYGWLRIKRAIDLNNAAIRQAVKAALADLAGD